MCPSVSEVVFRYNVGYASDKYSFFLKFTDEEYFLILFV